MTTIDYQLSGDGTYYIVNGLTGGTSITNMVIDATYAGLPVKEIAEDAFYNKGYTITGTLTLPDSLTSIGSSAFFNCTGLTGNLNLSFTKLTSIETNTFRNCGFNGTLSLPNLLTYIGLSSFQNCKFTGYLNLLTLTQTPTLELGSFGYCNFTTLSLPNNATYNQFPFQQCSPLLTNIIVDEFVSIEDSGIFIDNPITYVYFLTKNNYDFSIWQSYNLTAYAYIDVKSYIESFFSSIYYYEQLTSNITPYVGDTVILSWFTPLTLNYEYIIKINGTATGILSDPSNIVSTTYTITGEEGPTITFQLYKMPDTSNFLSELTFTIFEINVTPNPIVRTRNGTISWKLPPDTYSLFVDNDILSTNLTNNSSFPLSIPFTTNLSVGNHEITMYSSQGSPYYKDFLVSDICFIKGTLVKTDQGYIAIEKITKQTIYKKYIQVTKTIYHDPFLVKVSAYAFGDVPTSDTYMSMKHKIFHDGCKRAQDYVNDDTITLVPYDGEPLYNILLNTHTIMTVHGMIVETLDPQSDVAIFHRAKLSPNEKKSLLFKLNENVNYKEIMLFLKSKI